MRYLVVTAGTIETSSFWPKGLADADTIKLNVNDGGFYYGSPFSQELTQTHVFNNAYCLVNKKKFPLIDKKGIVEIRLQGVDAPELHFPVESKKTDAPMVNYRQYFGKTATVELTTALGGPNKTLGCEIWSYVDKPGDLFDAYGRVIGYAFITNSRGDDFVLNINETLLEAGLAFPMFYTSMQNEELEYFHYLAQKASRYRRGIWKYFRTAVRKSKLNLRFKYSDREYDKEKDLGTLIFPKVFRRACRWIRAIELGEIKDTTKFKKFLKSEPEVKFSYLDDILYFGTNYSIPVYKLEDLISSDNKAKISPLNVVFYETPSIVYKKNGEAITDFEDSLYEIKTITENNR